MSEERLLQDYLNDIIESIEEIAIVEGKKVEYKCYQQMKEI